MKFQKGLLNDIEPGPDDVDEDAPAPSSELHEHPPVVDDVEKNRLFETVKKETGSERNYLKVLGVIIVVVVAVGFAISYLTAPGVGDKVRAPKGLEDAVRDHLLTKEKRTATDITFYQCGGYYWARAGVETRNDIANPLFKVASYSARATLVDGQYSITAAPITSPESDVPCR